MRTALVNRTPVSYEKQRWQYEIEEFKKEFRQISAYPE